VHQERADRYGDAVSRVRRAIWRLSGVASLAQRTSTRRADQVLDVVDTGRRQLDPTRLVDATTRPEDRSFPGLAAIFTSWWWLGLIFLATGLVGVWQWYTWPR